MMRTCPRGHQWAPSGNGQATASDSCPTCGAAPLAATVATEFSAAAGPVDPDATLEPSRLPELPAEYPTVPGYEVRGVLGSGGMGIVYQAWHVRLKRLVALKMIRGDAHANAEQLHRFRVEAEAVARLQHANVVQVYEVGEAGGRPYLALEYVDGPSLGQRLAGEPLPPRQAAAIAVTLARAVQAAHERGVVHRDLKPTNVLLTAQGMPKVSDFGLAKQLDADRGQTQSGAVVGTPSYMAPEQALGKVREIGPAVDVYALGALLYEMLTGRPPFKADTALNTIYQVVTEDVLPPRRLQSKLPLDLETICLKCLEKEPKKRYPSALALADDLRHFLAGRPVSARPTPAWERAWKWARRRPAAAALLTVSAVAALALLLGGLWFTVALGAERNRAVEEKQRAERGEERALEQQQRAEVGEAKALEQQKRAETGEADARGSLEDARRAVFTGQIWRVDRLWKQDPLQARSLLLQADVCPPDRRDFAWRLYYRACDCQAAWLHPEGDTVAVAVAADGKTLATAGADGTMRLWDVAKRKETATLRGHKGSVNALAFTRDGRLLASGGADKKIRLWDPAARTEVGTLEGHRNEIRQLAFTPDGKTLASCSGWEDPKEKNTDFRMKDGQVYLWDVPWRKGTLVLTGPTGFLCLAVSPDGKTVAAGTISGWNPVYLVDVAQKKKVAGPFQTGVGWPQALAFHPDGKILALGKADNRVHLLDVETGKQFQNIAGHRGELASVAFSPDGKTLASGGSDGLVKVWDVAGPRARILERTTFRVHFDSVRFLEFLPDGRLATGGDDGVKLWRLPDRLERATLKGDGQGFHAAAMSADGKTLATGGRNHAVTLWDVRTGRDVKTLSGHAGPVVQVALAPDGKSLTAVSYGLGMMEQQIVNWEVKTWTLPGGAARDSFKRPAAGLVALALAPDGGTVAVAQQDRSITLWSAEGKQRAVLPGHAVAVTALAFSADSHTLATASARGETKLWDVTAGTERLAYQGHAGPVYSLAFSADGSTLASAGVEAMQGNAITDLAVKLWDASSGKPRLTLQRQPDLFRVLAFTPDGRTLAGGGQDCTVKLWDTTSGHLRTVLTGHTRRITGLAFTPDGNVLASASGVLGEGWWIKEGEVKLWDARERPKR